LLTLLILYYAEQNIYKVNYVIIFNGGNDI
jgi:hypothetical protein